MFQKNNPLIFDLPPPIHNRGINLLHLQIAYPFEAVQCEDGFLKWIRVGSINRDAPPDLHKVLQVVVLCVSFRAQSVYLYNPV